MGENLPSVNLGSNFEIQLCFDYSPTSSPSISLSPTLSPSIFQFDNCRSKISFQRNSCVIGIQGLKCWGYNLYGPLGYENTADRGSSTNEMGDYLPYVNLGTGLDPVSIQTGLENVCIFLSNLQIKCFGKNIF